MHASYATFDASASIGRPPEEGSGTLVRRTTYTGTLSEATYPSSTLPVTVASCSEWPSAKTMSESSEVRARFATLAS